jgi:nucleolin
MNITYKGALMNKVYSIIRKKLIGNIEDEFYNCSEDLSTKEKRDYVKELIEEGIDNLGTRINIAGDKELMSYIEDKGIELDSNVLEIKPERVQEKKSMIINAAIKKYCGRARAPAKQSKTIKKARTSGRKTRKVRKYESESEEETEEEEERPKRRKAKKKSRRNIRRREDSDSEEEEEEYERPIKSSRKKTTRRRKPREESESEDEYEEEEKPKRRVKRRHKPQLAVARLKEDESDEDEIEYEPSDDDNDDIKQVQTSSTGFSSGLKPSGRIFDL